MIYAKSNAEEFELVDSTKVKLASSEQPAASQHQRKVGTRVVLVVGIVVNIALNEML